MPNLKALPEPSQPVQRPFGVTRDDSAGFDERPYLSSPVKPVQLDASYYLSPRAQAWWQGPTSSTSPRSNVSANPSSQLASSPAVATPPATTSTPALSSVQRLTQPTTPLSTLLLDAPSPLHNHPSLTLRVRRRPRSASLYLPIMHQARPQSLKVHAEGIFASRNTSICRYHFRDSFLVCSLNSSTLHTVHQASPNLLFQSPWAARCTKIGRYNTCNRNFSCLYLFPMLETNDRPLTDLPAHRRAPSHAPNLDWQYNECDGGMHSVIQDHVFPHTISLVNETDSAEKELKAITEQIAAVERDWGGLTTKFHSQLRTISVQQMPSPVHPNNYPSEEYFTATDGLSALSQPPSPPYSLSEND
ncbi:hypothetical protein FRC01_004503 [Tulasnella sp. 417]|nr:hypothetical protein FRC01_004503 [Tulasnella sp. 417]